MDPLLFPREGHGPYRVLRGFAKGLVDRFHAACSDPETAQRERLKRILGQVQGTTFGEEHGIEGNEGLRDFREKVPIRGDAEWRPWLERIQEGEDGVLTRSRVRALVQTSGTTGASKFLPVTGPWAKVVAEGQTLWRLGLVRDCEAITRGGALTLVSPGVEGRLPSGLPYGSNTGRMQRAQPWIVRLRYPVPAAVHALEDPDARMYALLRFALQSDLSSITTANPSTLLLLCRKLLEFQEDLAADLEEGRLARGPAAAIPDGLRRTWDRSMKRGTPPAEWKPAKIWPLERIQCWKGGAAPFFLERLEAAMGADLPVRDVGITASEGYFAIPENDGNAGGVAWLGGHVLEFLDEKENPHWAWELEVDRQYRLVITTSAGLVRYDLDDVVEVTGHVGRAPVFRFVRRGSGVLNVTGEKLTEDQVVRSVREVVGGRDMAGFTAGHQMAEVPCILVLMEGAGPREEGLGGRLDEALARSNVEYASKRKTGRLGPVVVEWLPPGTYARYRAQRVREGAPDGQVKDPILALDEAALERVRDAGRGSGDGG